MNPTNQHYLPHHRISRQESCSSHTLQRQISVFQAKLYVGKLSHNHLSQVKPKRTKLSRSFLFLNCFLNPKMTSRLQGRWFRTGSCWCHCPAYTPIAVFGDGGVGDCLCVQPAATCSALACRIAFQHPPRLWVGEESVSLTFWRLEICIRPTWVSKGWRWWSLTVSCSPTMWPLLHINRQYKVRA